jgi:Tfp pilus assembly protein PilF
MFDNFHYRLAGRFLWMITTIFFLSSCSHLINHARDKEKAKIYLQLAADQLQEREYNKALESTQAALKFDPGMAAAYNHLALIYMETKRYQKSEEAFKKALEVQSAYPEVFNNYGVLLNRQDRYAEATKNTLPRKMRSRTWVMRTIGWVTY